MNKIGVPEVNTSSLEVVDRKSTEPAFTIYSPSLVPGSPCKLNQI